MQFLIEYTEHTCARNARNFYLFHFLKVNLFFKKSNKKHILLNLESEINKFS